MKKFSPPTGGSNNKTEPLVSVIMPVYNAGVFLRESIESILKQTYKHFELIIVDDASTDGSWKIIQRFKKRYPSIIRAYQLKNQLNKGGDACANIAYKKARGKFIARMDADDIAVPERLEKQVAFLLDKPDVIMVGSQAHVINRKSKVIGEKNVPLTHDKIYENYFIFHPMIHPTVMIRKRMLPKRPYLYKIKYSANNDLYTFFEFLNFGKFANLKEKLLCYRIHGGNDSLTKPKERFLNTVNIRFTAMAKYGYRPTIKGFMTTIVQFIIISLMPERLIVPIYLYTKGIYTSPLLDQFRKARELFAYQMKSIRYSFS